MKTLLFTFLFSICGIAVATTSHEYNEILNGITLDNVCVTSTTVQTVRPVKVCIDKREVKFENDGQVSTDYICVKWNTKNLVYPRKDLPDTILVRTWTENGEASSYPGVQSSFTFPICN